MTERERLGTTLGILLAGLLQAEEAEAASERRPRLRFASGVYPLGEAVAPAEPEALDPREPVG